MEEYLQFLEALSEMNHRLDEIILDQRNIITTLEMIYENQKVATKPLEENE